MSKLDWSKAKTNRLGSESIGRHPARARAVRRLVSKYEAALSETPWLGFDDPRCEEVITLEFGKVVDAWRGQRHHNPSPSYMMPIGHR